MLDAKNKSPLAKIRMVIRLERFIMTAITKDADALFCVMYKAYLEKTKDKVPRSEALVVGGMFDIQNNLAPTLSLEDVRELCEELESAGYLVLVGKCDGGFGMARIAPGGVIRMENRFKNGMNDVLDFLGKIKGVIPFI